MINRVKPRKNGRSSRFVGVFKPLEATDSEKWSPVCGFEGLYMVSSFGRIKSLNRVVTQGKKCTYLKTGRILKQIKNDLGYYFVNLFGDGFKKTVKVHRLVALSFSTGAHPDLVVDHKDGNPRNNHFSNLRWVTRSLNLMNIHKTSTKSGVAGVRYRHGLINPWEARGTINGKYTSVGHYKTMELAIEARQRHLDALFKGFTDEIE
ncbi:NUMOD4 motif-containing HNH endonuclease [Pantoea dispersa]|uniref:NUMOD4 motif-containing HNH endonuclease n=1 Tax=Pantoea dispersa TaxID=59814 RepID=UPI0028DD5327|nr:NUMOD4 motif-containing HNH endonuclease [Pantoea dispersa]MDT8853028.1 NUMOD4 motif-containing HNH endonuclease [Pantoea dispersa]